MNGILNIFNWTMSKIQKKSIIKRRSNFLLHCCSYIFPAEIAMKMRCCEEADCDQIP